ncbi:MAG: hypothetical protein KJ670_09035, partial [Alphaproteobacteria bacterium]|nr:hypothetical protein [Alphaproteobacteria bacterium]
PSTFLFLLIFNCQKTDDIKPSQKLNTKPSGPAIHQHLSQFLEVFEEPECRSPRRRRPLVR